MPVSVITDVITWVELGLQVGMSVVELGLLTYLISGGWLDLVRTISFYVDSFVINFIDLFYSYFEKIMGGRIFHPDVVDRVMTNVYVFVSLIVLLKMMILFMKYMANPEMVSDDKVGSSALIKRVIIGMSGMLMLPMIFNFGLDLQAAIINDNLFGKLLMDKSELREYEKNKNKMGRILGFNIYQGFWHLDISGKNLSENSTIVKNYRQAVEQKDPEAIGGVLIWGGINEKHDGEYAYDYFPVASCVILIYVFWLILKYNIDVVVRMFKLFLLQMLGPLAISDYMINGDSKEVFKNWLKTTISVYAMLFVRIFSIWFVSFVTILMNKECTNIGADGLCADSLLYVVGGQEPDYILRGIITLGLLVILMDLPKFISDVLGLDLEQDATVKGIMQKGLSAAKGVASGALAFTGAAVGGAVGAGKAVIGQTKFGKNMEKSRNKIADKHGTLAMLGKQGSTFGKGLLTSALNTNSMTGSLVKGYQGQNQSQQSVGDKAKQDSASKERERQEEKEKKEKAVRDVTERVVETLPKDTPAKDIKANVIAQMYGEPNAITAKINGRLSAISSSGEKIDLPTVTQQVKQVLGERFNVAPGEVEQVVKQVIKNPSSITPNAIEQVVNQVINNRVKEDDQIITQVVNQVFGTRVNNTVDDATQTINQTLNRVATNTEEMNVYAEITAEHVENIRQDVSQQVNIQREIKENTEEINAYTGLTAENTEKSTKILDSIDKKS